MIFKKEELKLLWPFYLEKFLTHVLFFAPAFWILQFQQNLSLFQIGILLSILSITTFLFEVPTGAFADLFGRKASVLFGYFITAILLFFLPLVTEFYSFIIIFFGWGVSSTFISGAKESWVIDNLKSKKKSSLVKDFFLKQQSILSFSLFFSGFLGAFIVGQLGLNVIWIFASLSYLASGLILMFIDETKLTKEKKQTFKQIFSQSKIAIKFAINHHVILFVLLATFFVMFRDSFSGDLVWQPFLNNLGFPLFGFGVLFSFLTLSSGIAPLLSGFFNKFFNQDKYYLSFLLGINIVLDLLVFFVKSYYLGILLLMLMFFSMGLFFPISMNYLQGFIPSNMRATITSFQSMVASLAYALSFLFSGGLAEIIGPKYTIVIGGIFLIPSLIFYLRINEDKKT